MEFSLSFYIVISHCLVRKKIISGLSNLSFILNLGKYLLVYLGDHKQKTISSKQCMFKRNGEL